MDDDVYTYAVSAAIAVGIALSVWLCGVWFGCERGVKLWTSRLTPLDHAVPSASQLSGTCWGRIMWAALLTVGALSLLISSALAAIATYLYFFGTGDGAEKEFPAIAPDEDPADRQSALAAQDFLQSAARKK